VQTAVNMVMDRGKLRWVNAIERGLAHAGGFIRKDIVIAVSYRLQFLYQFSQVFFKVAVIYFIGQMVASSGTPQALRAYSSDYFVFALVGLAVNSYLSSAMVTITGTIRQMMDTGVLEVVCATPVKSTWLLLYTALWPFLFATIRVVMYFVLGVGLFGAHFDRANWLGATLTMALALPIFLLLAVISSSILIVVKKGDPANWFFTSISGLLAGTMFPITVLPGWLYVLALCLPLTHVLEALRRCLLVGAGLQDVARYLLTLLLFLAVLLPITIAVNRGCMVIAKRRGAFSTY